MDVGGFDMIYLDPAKFSSRRPTTRTTAKRWSRSGRES